MSFEEKTVGPGDRWSKEGSAPESQFLLVARESELPAYDWEYLTARKCKGRWTDHSYELVSGVMFWKDLPDAPA